MCKKTVCNHHHKPAHSASHAVTHSDIIPGQCIVPPYMLEALRLRGDAKLQKMAADLMKHAEDFRDNRIENTPSTSFIGAPVLRVSERPVVYREVYDGQQKAGLPGVLARSEGDDATNDKDIDAAYDGSGDVFDLYLSQYRRNSLDGKGMTLKSTVHHRKDYNNAFWNGEQMAYGDGDGKIFKTFTELSVIGHELSHGVVQFSGGLIYQDQSGALNESFSDVFGALTVQYKNKQTAGEADWLIGKGILGDDINGVSLRSMKEPGHAYDDPLLGKDPQPFHMDFYVYTANDNGGVHINSGIPNHAFYLLSQLLGGYAWEKAGKIWYDTMQSIQNPYATFYDWALMTLNKARERYGVGSREYLLTQRAWKLVGINI